MISNSPLTIAILKGDGIGIDVTNAVVPLFNALNIPVDIKYGEIGWSCFEKKGTPIPDKTWQLINTSQVALLGATCSKPEREVLKVMSQIQQTKEIQYISPIIQLRQQLALYANVRPCFNISNKQKYFNFCVIRENTEGLYAGFDYHPIPNEVLSLIKTAGSKTNKEDISCTLRIQSKKGLTRIFNFAFDYAIKNNLARVTFADKPNVLRKSSAFAREIFESIANQHPNIKSDIINVDALALWILKKPQNYGIIVAENMFGDILSDVGAGVMGGLGFAPSANIGEKACYFEPVHGSGPNIPKNKANPSAMFLTVALLLKHFSLEEHAKIIIRAVKSVVNEGRYITYDIGGDSSCMEMANAIIDRCCSIENNYMV